MRKLIVSMNVTLDGYMSGSECELDWHFQYWTKEMAESLCEQLSKADTILLGRVTYNAMARYWLSKVVNPSLRGEDFAFANMMNSYDKIVFSKTITLPEWSNSKLVSGNLEDEINLLKQKPGKDIIVYGSGRLVNSLIKSGMVDEYQLWLHPVVLGKGKPLFKNLHSRLHMKLMNIKTSAQVLLSYIIKQIKQTKMKHINKNVSEEFSKGNFEFAFNHFADDIQWNVVGSPVIKGKKAVIAYCNKMMTEMDRSKLNNTNQIGDDDLIAVQGYCDYVKENNEPGRLEYCDVYRFNDEKLQAITSYCIETKNG